MEGGRYREVGRGTLPPAISIGDEGKINVDYNLSEVIICPVYTSCVRICFII